MSSVLQFLIVSSLSLILALGHSAGPARAHEVLPTIGDVSQDGSTMVLTLRLPAEAILAGLDLDQVSDTNEAPEAASYDRLRALSDADLAVLFTEAWPDLAKSIVVAADGQPLALLLSSVAAEPQPDIDLDRTTQIDVRADLPDNAQ